MYNNIVLRLFSLNLTQHNRCTIVQFKYHPDIFKVTLDQWTKCFLNIYEKTDYRECTASFISKAIENVDV